MKANLFLRFLVGVMVSGLFSQAVFAEDLMARESLGKIKYGQPEKTVVELLGKPGSKGKEMHWEATGDWVQEWSYPGQGITLHMAAAKQGGLKKVLMITGEADCKEATARGIKIGSSLAEVRKAYGNVEDKENSNRESFVAGSIYGGVIFGLKDHKVVSIFIGAAAE